MADDDPDDRLLMKEALEENQFSNPLSFVENGADLLDYLTQQGKYAQCTLPGLILLDLNMPKVSGLEALQQIRINPNLKRIPVVVLTTSNSQEDVLRSYNLGVNSYICKPGKFKELVAVTREIGNYWLNTVSLPT